MPRSTTHLGVTVRAIPVIGLGAALTLAGCSSSGDDEATATPSPSPTVEETTQAPEPEVTETEAADSDDPAGGDAAPSGDPLQDYVDLERAQLEQMADTLGDMYSDISIDADPPSGIVYTYTFAEQMDSEVAQQSLADVDETLEELVDTAVFPMMERSGVEGPQSATYTYLNADGTELWSGTFTSE